AMAMGAALAGVISNVAGINDATGNAGIANAAQWLFALFTLAPVLAWVMARRATRAQASTGGLTVS
ncbi:MFS transporter, partial [Pseudomonas sp. SIMBA_064]